MGTTNEEGILSRLSIVLEEVTSGPGYHVVLLDDGDQIGIEDAPGTMLMDFSDDALLENAELSEEDARALQEHSGAVCRWVEGRGYKVLTE